LAVAAVLALVAVGASVAFSAISRLPNDFRVQRTLRIQAPPETVFAFVNDPRQWRSWSPYETFMGASTAEAGGQRSGRGAIYLWKGEGKVSDGRMEIAESVPFSKIQVQLDFKAPVEGRNLAEFSFEPKGEYTFVTWSMHGSRALPLRLRGLVTDLDELVGRDFDAGLTKLKHLAESAARMPRPILPP
jgi:uncharacterized protein YndB with AHSA1/START domain